MADPGNTPTYARGFTGRRWHRLPELWWTDQVRPCTRCRTPTQWSRPRARGAATHPMCEATAFDSVTEQLYLDVLFTVASLLGATVIVEAQTDDVPVSPRRLGDPHAGCELCGRGYAALWIAARTWRCPMHPPVDEHYRRRS